MLSENVCESIRELARKCGIRKVVLFGSRARGDNGSLSDIDLAVWGGNVVEFRTSIDEVVPTLLMFDVVNMESKISDRLRENVQRDGKLLYDAES